ncbi:MAG: hypothetical protein JWO91_418 [Acidobacteriaceae bacterium]|nr:hypothetical protein [Acidobacteriaceae bacterium]
MNAVRLLAAAAINCNFLTNFPCGAQPTAPTLGVSRPPAVGNRLARFLAKVS